MYKSFIDYKQSPKKQNIINIKPYSRKQEQEIRSFVISDNQNTGKNQLNSKIENKDILRAESGNKNQRNAYVKFKSNLFLIQVIRMIFLFYQIRKIC